VHSLPQQPIILCPGQAVTKINAIAEEGCDLILHLPLIRETLIDKPVLLEEKRYETSIQ
jgi:hypothetical protein